MKYIMDKLKIPYYEQSRDERKNYSDYCIVTVMVKTDFSKKQKELDEIKAIILVGLLLPLIWKFFEWYAEHCALWLVEAITQSLPIALGVTFGLVWWVYAYVMQPKYDYAIGEKMVGVNFLTIHKQYTQGMTIFYGLISLLLSWIAFTESAVPGNELLVMFLSFVVMLTLASLSNYGYEYGNVFKHNVELGLKE